MTPLDSGEVLIVVLLSLLHCLFVVHDSGVVHVVVNVCPGILIVFNHMLAGALLHLTCVLD